MIEKLNIKNFQSHADTTFNFNKGVNVIIGKTDAGKSAAIRALKLVAFNKPSGDSYRSKYWKGDTSVEVLVDGITISRNKGKVNSYILGETVLTAFGASVPEEVQKVLNLNETNFQFQLDSHFLLSDSMSAGDVAKHFNKVANLDEIDHATKAANGFVSSSNAEIKRQKANQKEIDEKLQTYSYLEDMELKVSEIVEVEQKLIQITDKRKQLKSALKKIKELTPSKDTIKRLNERENVILNGLKLSKAIRKSKERTEQLSALYNKLEKAKKEQRQNKDVGSVTLLNTLTIHYAQLKQIQKLKHSLSELLNEYQNTNKSWRITKREYLDLESEYTKNLGSTCPLCGSKNEKKRNK